MLSPAVEVQGEETQNLLLAFFLAHSMTLGKICGLTNPSFYWYKV